MQENIFDATKEKLKQMPLVDLLVINGDDITERIINNILLDRHEEYDLSLQTAIKSNEGQIIYYTLPRISKNLIGNDIWDSDIAKLTRNAGITDLINALNEQIGINYIKIR